MEGVIDFAHAVNASLTTSFAISSGVRDAAGVWTPDQARKLLDYTKAIGGDIVASEFFNEPTMPEYGGAPPGYDAAAYARDFAVFRQFAREAAPEMRVVGPASVGEAVLLPAMRQGSVSVLKTVDLLSVDPPPIFDIFSYHFYGAASIRCAPMGSAAQTSPEAALSEGWLSRADQSVQDMALGEADIHQAMITMEQANLSLRLMIDVRNKIIAAYEEIMRLQL